MLFADLANSFLGKDACACDYVQVNLNERDSISKNTRGCRLAWSRLVDLGSIDPGSNPGNPTTPNIISHAFKLPSEKTSEGLLFCTNQTCGCLQHCNSVEEHRAISVS